MRWRDLDLDAGRLSVHRQLIELQDRAGAGLTTSLIFKRPKSNSGLRTLGIDKDLVSLLKARMREQAELRTALGLTWGRDDLVFAHVDGRPLSPGSMSTAFHNFALRAGLPKNVSLHGLRRTFGAHAVANGMSPGVLARVLGHSRPAFTLGVYGPFLPGEDNAVRLVVRRMRRKAKMNRKPEDSP